MNRFFGRWRCAPPWAVIEHQLGVIIRNQENIMSALDDLTAQVIESALSLINGIAARIAAAGTDPAALAALTADLKTEDDALAAAAQANTPAAP